MRAAAWSAAGLVPAEKLTFVDDESTWVAAADSRPVGMPKVDSSHWEPVKPESHVHVAVDAPVALTPDEVVGGTPAAQTVPRQLQAALQWVPQSAPNQPSRQRHWSVSGPALALVAAMPPSPSVTV